MNKRIAAFIFAITALLFLLSSCGASIEPESRTFFAMDTVMNVNVYGNESLIDGVAEIIYSLEEEFSVTDENSVLGTVNSSGCGILSSESAKMLKRALWLCDDTGGALDLTIYPILRAWGFTTDEYRVPEGEEIKSLLALVDYQRVKLDDNTGKISVDDGMMLDAGSVLKGYAGCLAADYLMENGVSSALLDLGGSIQTVGGKPDGTPWRVAIKDPCGSGSLGIVNVRDCAVVTSGGYERYFTQNGNTYWHILDPATGYPARSGLLSVTVIGPDGLICDGLSTALFVMGVELAAKYWQTHEGFDLIMADSSSIYITEGIKDTFVQDKSSPYTLSVIEK